MIARRSGATAVAVVLSGCGNVITTDINGMTGVTVDDSGRPLLVAELCHGLIAGITVTGPNRGTVANDVRADLTAAQPVEESVAAFDLATPSADWSGTALPLPLQPDLYIAYAHGGNSADSQLSQVSFTAAELAELEPGTVQLGSHEPGEPVRRVELAGFHRLACQG